MTQDHTKKILVIRFSSLGDVILTTALFPNLKNHWPNSEITVLTKSGLESVFDQNPSVDHVHVFNPSQQSFSQLAKEMKEQKYDVIVDLHGNLRSFVVRLFSAAPLTVVVKKRTLARYKLLLFKKSSPSLQFSVRERILNCLDSLDVPCSHSETQLFPKKVDEVLGTYDINPAMRLIGVAPGAKHNTKRWPAQKFAEAANRLGAVPQSMVLVLGDKSDSKVATEVSSHLTVPFRNLAGWTSLSELIAITSRLSFLLTNDSGILHVGEALKIPMVALFGPTVRAFGFAPYRPTSRVAEVTNLPCRPCTLHGNETCPLNHHKCMEDIDINAVLYATADLFESSASSPAL